MGAVYHKDVESSAVEEARETRKRLLELGIDSPEIGKMYKLKIDNKTMMYFKDAEHRASFVSKYYNRNKKKYNFEREEVEM